MGKGSGRRPTQISDAEFQANMDRMGMGPAARKKQATEEPAKPATEPAKDSD